MYSGIASALEAGNQGHTFENLGTAASLAVAQPPLPLC